MFGIVGGLVIVIVVMRYQTWISLAVAIVAILPILVFAAMPIAACERLARARRRRNECVYCGSALGNRPLEDCGICACRDHPANNPQPQSGSPPGGAGRGKLVN